MVRLEDSSTILGVGAMAVRSSDEKHGAMAAGSNKKHERVDGISNVKCNECLLKLSIRSRLEGFTRRKERQRTFVNNGHHE